MRERFEVVCGGWVEGGVGVSKGGWVRRSCAQSLSLLPIFDEEVEILPIPLLFLFFSSSIPRLAITR